MARRSRRNRRRSRGRFAFLYKLLCFVLICAAIVGALVLSRWIPSPSAAMTATPVRRFWPPAASRRGIISFC